MTHPLLTPRFEVIADYPNAAHSVGDIIEIKEGGSAEIIITGVEDSCFSFNSARFEYFPIASFRRFSNLFRELEWWEYRTPEEMPKYFRFRTMYDIYVADRYSGEFVYLEDLSISNQFYLTNIVPCSQEEYDVYIDSKNQRP